MDTSGVWGCSLLSWYSQIGPNVVVFSRYETTPRPPPPLFDSGDQVPPLGFSALGMTIPQLSTIIVPSFDRPAAFCHTKSDAVQLFSSIPFVRVAPLWIIQLN